MANVFNLSKRLLELINNEDNFAIALVGEWGIGKTHFWNEFYKENHLSFKTKKYAYVSLFGIDSLESLKFEIALKTHNTGQEKDNLSYLKTGFKKVLENVNFSDIEGSGVTLSVSKGVISSTLSSMVNDTVICIDDIERLSDKLDIKDVMGLINHLNLEKNCKIIVLLDQAKAKEQFIEYKEKVFDDVLVLDESLSVIQKIVDDKMFDVYKDFYTTTGVKNLRFYQRVNKIYTLFIKSFSNLSETSNKQILSFILVIRMLYDMPHMIDENIDFNFFIESFDSKHIRNFRGYQLRSAYKQEDITPDHIVKFNKINNFINPFYSYFEISSWGEAVVNWLLNLELDENLTKELLERDLVTEETLMSDRLSSELLAEFHNMEIGPNFAARLYYMACAKIGSAQLNNLSFYCDILESCGELNLAIQLENHIKQYINTTITAQENSVFIGDFYFLGKEPNDRFYDYVTEKIEEDRTQNVNPSTILSIFNKYHESNRSAYNTTDNQSIRLIDKNILRDIIWSDISTRAGYRKQFVHSILLYPPLNEIEGKAEEVRKWILELLDEKIKANPNSEPSIRMWLEDTNNLTKNLR
uniref:KAP NTPase domain-containing protein n=1 Tax=Psychrobacter sp. (strain PRwf-1) TaxID=349106 RepID=A5WGZ5_PSYWF